MDSSTLKLIRISAIEKDVFYARHVKHTFHKKLVLVVFYALV